MAFQQIRPVSTVDQIIDQLLDVIRSDDLQVGDKLPSERELAKILGVSRSTLREAVITLTTIGVLEIQRGVGMFVKATDVSTTLAQKMTEVLGSRENPYEALELRVLLEPGLAALAAERASEEDYEKMEASLRISEVRSRNNESYFEADYDFHLAIVQSINNTLAEHALATALNFWFSDWGETAHGPMDDPGRLVEYHQIHEQIYQAIKDGNPDLARQHMIKHMDLIKEDFIRF